MPNADPSAQVQSCVHFLMLHPSWSYCTRASDSSQSAIGVFVVSQLTYRPSIPSTLLSNNNRGDHQDSKSNSNGRSRPGCPGEKDQDASSSRNDAQGCLSEHEICILPNVIGYDALS
mmetsp:Transcript_34532/g.81409  ORF Transcript_34532/g.81409 Transcript_34532/m.81409 type:complete len:117 (-) Transcript_34532:1179-1529(-)